MKDGRTWITKGKAGTYDPGTAQRLATELSTRAAAAPGTGQSAKALQAAATSFTHNMARINYSVCAAMAMPIGSGVTEAAFTAGNAGPAPGRSDQPPADWD